MVAGMRLGPVLLAMLLAAGVAQETRAFALPDDLAITGYGDVRAVIAQGPASWLMRENKDVAAAIAL